MRLTVIACLAFSSIAFGAQQPAVDFVKVDKSERKLYLYSNGAVIKTFPVALGPNEGPKRQEGDRKTPEGKYSLVEKKADSDFHKAILISYPNKKDRDAAKIRRVDPGGLIEIHGQSNSWWSVFHVLWQWKNWTDGCVALTDKDMDIVWDLVSVPTPIEITP